MASAGVNKAEMMKQAQSVWAMLDNMADTDSDAYKKFIDKNLKEGKDYMKFKKTPPEAHMCVKTKLTAPKSQPLYMNFCSWTRVPEPKSDDDPIPVISSDMQNINANVTTVNVSFSPSILKSYGRDCRNTQEQTALVNLAIDYVQDVHKVTISRTFHILPDKIFHGDWDKIVHSLRIKIDKDYNKEESMEDILKSMQQFGPMAQFSQETKVSELNKMRDGDVGTDNDKDEPTIVLPGMVAEKGKKVLIEEIEPERRIVEPGYSLKCMNSENEEPRRLVLNVDLEGVGSVKECELDVTQTEVTLSVKNRYHLALRLPESIQDDLSRAKFSKKTRTLTVTLPTVKS